MVDLIGPAAAGATPTLTTTTDVTSPVAGDTWYEDCTAGTPGTGTPAMAKWLNWVMQQLRVAIRASNVPLANSYDNMLSWAIQSGYPNWIGNAGGSVNALTGSVDNNPLLVTDGTIVRGVSSGPNTGAATFDLNELGVAPITLCSGQALIGGEIDGAFALMWIGSSWVVLSPYSLAGLEAQLFQINIQTFTSSGTWTAPGGFAPEARVIVEMWGGGQGGNALDGGAGGVYAKWTTYLGAIPSSVGAIVGAGGVGSFGLAVGGSGGATIFDIPGFEQTICASGVGGGAPAIDVSYFAGGSGANYGGSPGAGIPSVGGGAGGAPAANGYFPSGGGGASSTGSGGTGANGAAGKMVVTTIQG